MVHSNFQLAVAAAAVTVAYLTTSVSAHGYILIPESQFTGSATSAWIVQIDPTWSSDNWDGNTDQSVETWETLSAENGVTDLRTLLDGDTSLYGAECGFTNPDGTAQPIPSTSTATFSRAIQHVGPCEIWLDDTLAFNDTNCYADYGNEDVDVKSVFPVDYSQCESSGCSMMRFYWLAFQGVDDETVWQVYKDCIPLEGGSGSSTSTSTTTTTSSDDDTTTTESSDETEAEADTTTTDSSTDSTETTEAPSTDSEETSSTTTSSDDEDTESSDSSTTSYSTPSTDTPETTTRTTPTTSSDEGYSTMSDDDRTEDSSQSGNSAGGSRGGNYGGSYGSGNQGGNYDGSFESGSNAGSFGDHHNGGKGDGKSGGWSGGFGRKLKH